MGLKLPRGASEEQGECGKAQIQIGLLGEPRALQFEPYSSFAALPSRVKEWHAAFSQTFAFGECQTAQPGCKILTAMIVSNK